MSEINGFVTHVDNAVAMVQTPFGSSTIECDDWRIADNGGLKVGDHLSTLCMSKYPESENDRTIFCIDADTSVWVNGAHLPIRPEGS